MYIAICWTCREVDAADTLWKLEAFKSKHIGEKCEVSIRVVDGGRPRKERPKMEKAPWRGVKRVIRAGKGMQASYVELECGHETYAASTKKVRCRDCAKGENTGRPLAGSDDGGSGNG